MNAKPVVSKPLIPIPRTIKGNVRLSFPKNLAEIIDPTGTDKKNGA